MSGYKNAAVNRTHVQRVVAKAWELFAIWERSSLDADYNYYLERREDAARAIATLPPDQQKEFVLP